MENKPAIDFNQHPKGFARNSSLNSMSSMLTESLDVEVKNIDFSKRKTSEYKKIKSHSKSTDKDKDKEHEKFLALAFKFPISVPLLNLLRQPQLTNHQFAHSYLTALQS